MTRVTSIKDIGLVYEQMQPKNAAPVVEEKAKTAASLPKAYDVKKLDVKKITSVGSDKKAFVHKDSGPESATGFNKNIVDPKSKKIAGKDNHYEPEKFSAALEKTQPRNINNNMSKSIFDKLYEDVMKDDALDLGISAGPEGEAGDKTDLDLSAGEDTVTVKLDKDLAQKLHDALVEVLGGDEEVGGEGESEDLGGEAEATSDEDEQSHADKKEEDKDESNEEIAGEATELKEVPDSAGQSLTSKNNKVPGKLSHAKGSKASGDATGGTDGKPVALPDSKGHSLTSKSAHKVNAPGYKAGDLFK